MSDTTIHNVEGSAVNGPLTAGTFIGRDQIIVLSGYSGDQLEQVLARLRDLLADGRATLAADVRAARLTVTAPDGASILLSAEAAADLLPVAARQSEEAAYRVALRVNPRYGRWLTQFVPLAGHLQTVERPPGWSDVPPEFTYLEVRGDGANRQIRRVPLPDVTLALQEHPAIALTGAPGAGKTTVLYKLALDAAADAGRWLPLYVPLAEYRDYSSPYAFVHARWTQALGAQDLAGRLRGGGVLLLLDALNEMPFSDERDYTRRVAAWRQFIADWPGNRIVTTCRSRDYTEKLGIPEVEIAPLADERVQQFLANYLPATLAGQAWQHLADSPLLALVRNPYYLEMLAYLVDQGQAWPANRGQLFDGFVNTLLGREQQRRHAAWPGAQALRHALAILAEALQPLGEGTRLPRSRFLTHIPTHAPGEDGPVTLAPVQVATLGLAATLLDQERPAEAEEEVLRFFHHQLQEYFAGQALLARLDAGEDLAARWQAPRLAREMPDPGPLGDNEPLPPPPTTGWEEPTIMAAGLLRDPTRLLTAVQAVNPVLAGRCLLENNLRGLTAAAAVQQRLLADLGDRGVHLRARVAAGDVLGRLGDPRWQEIVVDGERVRVPPLVAAPGGEGWMGSDWFTVWRLARQGFPAQDERPRHRVTLPRFWIGQFPVTNAEYACFIEAGGYRSPAYWRTAAARAWLAGEETESAAVRGLMETWQWLRDTPGGLQRRRRAGWNPGAIAAWQELLQRPEAEVRAFLAQQVGDRPNDRPAFWDDERLAAPASPVVGVNWFEASAYAAWLHNRLRAAQAAGLLPADILPPGYEVRLPSEAEWERAARGTHGRVYPWGGRWQAGRANTWEGHLLRTSPVGAFPEGATPEGIHDLAGNVWEWTTTRYRPYPYRADAREDPEAEGDPVVRGGSWLNARWFVRCAFRVRYDPGDFDGNFGFRVVVSLAASGF
jgi:formylglycine-generating enzyme required for sulfatase activity